MSGKSKVFGNLADIETREVEWLWPQYIPFGLISVLEGDPNIGKSYLAMHITAKVTIGGTLPGAPHIRRGRVLYLSTEDEPDYTIRPRLEAMGADVGRVKIMLTKYLPFDEQGIRLLRAEMQTCSPSLIVVDTLFSFIPSGADARGDPDF